MMERGRERDRNTWKEDLFKWDEGGAEKIELGKKKYIK